MTQNNLAEYTFQVSHYSSLPRSYSAVLRSSQICPPPPSLFQSNVSLTWLISLTSRHVYISLYSFVLKKSSDVYLLYNFILFQLFIFKIFLMNFLLYITILLSMYFSDKMSEHFGIMRSEFLFIFIYATFKNYVTSTTTIDIIMLGYWSLGDYSWLGPRPEWGK